MDKPRFLSAFLILFINCLIWSPQLCVAGDRLSAELQAGFFVPDNHAIRGRTILFRDGDGDMTAIYNRGFGDFFEIKFGLNYHLSSWALRLDAGWKLAVNEPSAEEINSVMAYEKNRMEIYPFLFNITREASSENSKFVPFAGIGIGVYHLRWHEKYYNIDIESGPQYWSSDTKTIPGYNFLMGIKYRLSTNIFLKSEFSYDYVVGDLEVIYHYDNLDTQKVNIGGSSFRLGIIHKIF